MFSIKLFSSSLSVIILVFLNCTSDQEIQLSDLDYKIYPEVNESRPELPSPFTTPDNREFVIAFTKEQKYAIIPVTLNNERSICKQLVVDSLDFPHLVRTGLHDDTNLDHITSITNRTLEEITELGRPNGLSQAGFMAADEDIISVIKADNRIVKKLGLTHPEMAKPLFHILNMMDSDLLLNRWNMARHKWENIQYFYYNGHKVFVEAEDTKGGQQSIFDDDLQGGFFIRVWREPEEKELKFLKDRYNRLTQSEFDQFLSTLTSMNTGELEPQYIMRYGFYEGHTYWRTDPISIAFIFGLKTLPELESMFKNRLYQTLIERFRQS